MWNSRDSFFTKYGIFQVLSWASLHFLHVPVSKRSTVLYDDNILNNLIVPRATFLVFFIVPMPAIAVVGLFAAYDIYKASTLNVSLYDNVNN